ncbi:PAS domain S-box-containing protein [Rhodoligotrophos appendicifer]|uniref:PAS domain-containing hybrid sensor histidine kinase/response regulator n=1 Tax=Rhodoligotrophos appendicifer TaxID=987056 RepID=UPI00117EA620|nr:ATP-binding protein [Rhodoligotrophos appendicifer]
MVDSSSHSFLPSDPVPVLDRSSGRASFGLHDEPTVDLPTRDLHLLLACLGLVAVILIAGWIALAPSVSATVEAMIAVAFLACVGAGVFTLMATRKLARVAPQLEKRRDSEARYRQLIDNQADPIFHRDLNGHITFVNAAFERLFGTTSETALVEGLNFKVLEGMTHSEADAKLSLPPHRLSFEQKLQTRTGHCWLSWESAALLAPDGRLLEIQSVGRDITAQVSAIEEIRRARDDAEAANRAKSMFLATISHEIRTPMNGVLGMLDLLMGTDLTPEQRSYMRTADISGRALLSLIDEILDLSKAESDRVDLTLAPFDLTEMVENVTELLAPRAHAKNLEIACFVDPALPQEIVADGPKLRQILINLAGNAVKFTESGGIAVRVCLKNDLGGTARAGPYLTEWSVTDTGIGIDPDKIPFIFDAFSQVESGNARRYGGSGLGLTISRRLVERMGGDLNVRSTPSRGTTFRFEIAVEGVVPAESQEEIPPPLQGMTAFLVMSDGTPAELLQAYLEGDGAVVHRCPDAASLGSVVDAIAKAPASGPLSQLLVLVDSDLSADFVSAIDAIGRPGSLPRIWLLLTAEERSDVLPLISELYAGYLVKPLRRSSLRRWLPPSAHVGGAKEQKGPRRSEGARPPEPRIDRPLSILLVEDNRINAMLTRVLLERVGHKVTHVKTGLDAVEAARGSIDTEGQPFDLALMDIQMPDMDGLEATRQIRAEEASSGDGRRLPIVSLTANALEEDRLACLAAGMDYYLVKPFRLAELQEAMAHALSAPTLQVSQSAAGAVMKTVSHWSPPKRPASAPPH